MDAGRSAPSDFAGTRLECSDVRISWLADGPPMDTGWSAPSNFARTRSERSDVQTSWLADGLPTDTGLAIRSRLVRPLGKTSQTGLFNLIWLGANFDSQQLGSLENVASFAATALLQYLKLKQTSSAKRGPRLNCSLRKLPMQGSCYIGPVRVASCTYYKYYVYYYTHEIKYEMLYEASCWVKRLREDY